MLLVATFLTIHFGQWRQSWHGMPRSAQVGTEKGKSVPEGNEGMLAAIDTDTGGIVYSLVLDTPAGFAFHADLLYVNSMYGNRVLVLDRSLRIVDSFATRLMNDLHSLVSLDNSLMLTSSGTDSVLEISYDGTHMWAWLASEHGFSTSPTGRQVKITRNRDYRLLNIDTSSQATHCNGAVAARVDGRDVALVTLFHQGKLIAVDRATGRSRVLLRGMRQPHSVRRRPGGWAISDSRASSVILLTQDFWVDAIIEHDFNWVQDALPLGDDQIIVADANNSRLLFWDILKGIPVRSIPLPEEWKVYQVEIASPDWAAALHAAGTSHAV